MASYSRFRTDGWRQHSAAEIGQTNIVVRQAIASNTDLSGIFNHYDAPFAESPSFLTAAQAGDPRLPAEQLVNANPRQARPFAGATVAAQNWGEAARQGQGGVTLEHRFAGTQLVRATGWAARRKLDAGGVGRVIDLGREAARGAVGVPGRDRERAARRSTGRPGSTSLRRTTTGWSSASGRPSWSGAGSTAATFASTSRRRCCPPVRSPR